MGLSLQTEGCGRGTPGPERHVAASEAFGPDTGDLQWEGGGVWASALGGQGPLCAR